MVGAALIRPVVAALLLAATQAYGDAGSEIPRCDGCHGPDGRATAMPESGRIAGQNRDYLRYILRQYRAGRIEGLNGGLMTNAVRHIDEATLDAVADYYANLR
ncbi:MAG: hypothetical protein KIT73_16530 [Burkholderiales bacterium]|nr:hypothetical protein [Burkholderiales bacterium]